MLDNLSLYDAYEAEQARKERLRCRQEFEDNKEYDDMEDLEDE
jgi:hypothetical protein